MQLSLHLWCYGSKLTAYTSPIKKRRKVHLISKNNILFRSVTQQVSSLCHSLCVLCQLCVAKVMGAKIHSVSTQSFKSLIWSLYEASAVWVSHIKYQVDIWHIYSLYSINFLLCISLLSCGGSKVTKRRTLALKRLHHWKIFWLI